MSKCSCIKKSNLNFNVQVDFVSEDSINLLDVSDWNKSVEYEIPNTFTVTISNDEVSKEILLKPLQLNNITSKDTGFKFCDGIYCLVTESCGVKYTRRFALLDKAECGVMKIASKDFDLALKLRSYLDIIRNYSEFHDLEKAKEYYKILQKQLSLYDCNC